MRQYPRLVFDRKRRFGEIVVEYGGTNPVQASNLQPVGWSLDAWALGADGVLPWQTIGTARSWQQGDELSLFYPLPDAGRGTARRPELRARRAAEPGVVPSIRLKAYRRGQQDVEYLTLWTRQCGLPRGTVGRQVRAALHLSGSRQATETGGAEDAGRIDYSESSPPGSVGAADAHRRGPVPGSSRTPVPARRFPPSATRSVSERAVMHRPRLRRRSIVNGSPILENTRRESPRRRRRPGVGDGSHENLIALEVGLTRFLGCLVFLVLASGAIATRRPRIQLAGPGRHLAVPHRSRRSGACRELGERSTGGARARFSFPG